MQITIKLKDPKSCKGCPLVRSDYEDWVGYWKDWVKNWEACFLEYDYDGLTLKRPTKCIEENGE